ncbi:MAG: autotransporter outer membrane beta-barrel domain-containing protein [Kaistella sp.]
MKKHYVLFLAVGFTGSFFSQQKIDSITYLKLKNEIKTEILAEQLIADQPLTQKFENFLNKNRLEIKGYGVVNYYNYGKFDTDPEIKDKIDLERLNLYLGYQYNDRLSFKAEIEIEHGGAGVSKELDNQEEFGEIETEISKGGEVKLEQLNVNYQFSEAFNIRFGRLKVYLNSAQNLDSPTSYFTTHRQEMESAFLPNGWYENGIQIHGIINKKIRYYASVTTGLDASGFSSRRWIKDGHQQKFEMQNAESFAYSARVDYLFGTNKNTFAGIGSYFGNTTPNRPKNDLKDDAFVNILTGHVNYFENNVRFSGVVLWGNLQNSDLISKANTNLPNTLGAKRTPVGKNALGYSAEVGYEVLHLMLANNHQQLYPFVRYDFYDTMYAVAGDVVKKDRWNRKVFTAGLNYFLHPQIVIKAQYSTRTLGSENIDPVTVLPTGQNQKENTFSLGMAFTL